MLGNQIIRENQDLQCSTHGHAIISVAFETGIMNTEIKLLCPECSLKPHQKIRESVFQVFPKHQAYAISLTDLPHIYNSETEQPPTNFSLCQIEHIIIDEKSKGYSPRNLVYLPDKKILAACSKNGHVMLWSIGEKLEFVAEFDVPGDIRFAKYMDIDEERKYLMICTGIQIYVFDTKNKIDLCISVLSYESEVNDFDWNTEEETMFTVGFEKAIRVWNLRDFSYQGSIDLTAYDTDMHIVRIIYLKERSHFVIEDIKGIYIFHVPKKEIETRFQSELVKKYEIPERGAFGFAHLPRSSAFIIRSNNGVHVVDSENLEFKYGFYTNMFSGNRSRALDSKMLVNEDQSQILADTPPNRLYVYRTDGISYILRQYGLVVESSALEFLPNQHRFVIGDQDLGSVIVLRTNVPKESEFRIYDIEYPPFDLKKMNKTEKEVNEEAPESMNEETKTRRTRSTRSNVKKKTEKQEPEHSLEQLRERNRGGNKKQTRSRSRKGGKKDVDSQEMEEEEEENAFDKKGKKGKGKGKSKKNVASAKNSELNKKQEYDDDIKQKERDKLKRKKK